MTSKVQNQKSAIIYCITIISKNIIINERNSSDCKLLIVHCQLSIPYALSHSYFATL